MARAVDVVEPIARFTDTGLRGKHPRVANIYNVGLEEWAPDLAPSVPAAEASSTALQRDGAGREGMEVRRARRKYGLIWTQWCVGHLTDDQLVEYLRRCTLVLEGERASEGSAEGAENDSAARDGVIVLKENVTSSKDDIYDERDSSVTR